jgi:TRAP-type C4-dicarboxylate transport system substrate-binding protein
MHFTRRILTTILALIMILTMLAACGTTATTTTAATTKSAAVTTVGTTAAPAVIKLITSVSAVKGGAMQQMQESIDEVFKAKGKGWFEFKHYDSGTLFKQDAEYAAVSKGDIDMSFVSPSWYSDNGMPWFSMYDSAFLYKNPDHFSAVFDPKGETGKAISDRVFKETNGNVKIVGAVFSGTRTLWLRKKTMIVNKPEDLAKIKLRMSNSASWLLMGRAIGAIPTPLDGAEVYLAMQNGTIDAQENFIPSSNANKIGEVSESICLTNHLQGGQTVAVNGKTWGKMTAEQQALFTDLMIEALQLSKTKVVTQETQILKALTDKGMLMQKPDIAAFKAYAKKVYLADPLSKSWDLAMYDKVDALATKY